ncbi:MAG: hypothetical protein Q8O14_14010 [bacterium]|jgi:hypothetical protein|nr:hypothetical protein [bacterium]
MDLLPMIGRHPWLTALLLGLAALLVYAVAKRLLKLALILALALAGLLLWMRLTDHHLPPEVEGLVRRAGKTAQQAVEKSGELLRKGEEALDK